MVTKASKYDGFAAEGWTNVEQVKQALESRDKAIVDIRKERDAAKADAEEWRKKLTDLVTYCAKALDTRIDEVEVRTKLDEMSGILDQFEDMKTAYSKDKLKWAETETEFVAEIARLTSILGQENVLENVNAEELLKELVKRLLKILRLN